MTDSKKTFSNKEVTLLLQILAYVYKRIEIKKVLTDDLFFNDIENKEDFLSLLAGISGKCIVMCSSESEQKKIKEVLKNPSKINDIKNLLKKGE